MKLLYKISIIILFLHHDHSFALANPASLYCAQVGGKTIIETLPSQGEIGICLFRKHYECEEWALFRKNCPIGGINTEHLNKEERYCMIRGGKPIKTQCVVPTL